MDMLSAQPLIQIISVSALFALVHSSWKHTMSQSFKPERTDRIPVC